MSQTATLSFTIDELTEILTEEPGFDGIVTDVYTIDEPIKTLYIIVESD